MDNMGKRDSHNGKLQIQQNSKYEIQTTTTKYLNVPVKVACRGEVWGKGNIHVEN